MSSFLYTIEPIGVVHSTLTRLQEAPMQGDEGAPEARLELTPHLSRASGHQAWRRTHPADLAAPRST